MLALEGCRQALLEGNGSPASPHPGPARTLVITNDFPPRPGGIQYFVHGYASRLPAGSVVVYASTWQGAADFDRVQPFPVIREATGMLLPTAKVARRAREIARAEGCTAVWFGAAAPLGLLAPGLRRAGLAHLVGTTHGHEAGWAALPGARTALRRIAASLDHLTYLGEYTRRRIARAIGPAAARMRQLAPGVDPEVFHPGAAGEEVRRRHNLGGRPIVVCVSRLVARKGQDMLIRALPRIQRQAPGAALLLVGGGPYRARLVRLASEVGVSEDVVFTGSVPWAQLPAHYAAGDVFAMPCRTRLGGLDVEGLGVVYLEASATGLPVVAGRSGGAPDAVRDEETGYLVDGRSVTEIGYRVGQLLAQPGTAARMGAAGREWVSRDWRWEVLAARLGGLLAGEER